MTLNTHIIILNQLADDIHFLAQHARCPERQRRLLLEWSSLVRIPGSSGQ